MGRARRLAGAGLLPLLLLGVALLSACSPAYVLQSAAGEADLLLRRRSIEKALADSRTPPALRAELRTVQSARAFAFKDLGLKPTKDFTTYSPISRDAVTYLVSGSRRLSLQPYEWRFPFVGSFPYKGYFDKKRALAERDRLERRGWDACVFGAAAYETPLPFSDPLPTSALDQSTGSLAALVIHELAHGTVYFKDHSDFDEALATFVGQEGALRYLAARLGADSLELAAYRSQLKAEAAADQVFGKLREELTEVYASTTTDAVKLQRREALFRGAQASLRGLGYDFQVMNNAVVTAHGVYHSDLPFAALLAQCGEDFPKFIAALKTLDKKDPSAALRRRVQAGD